MNDVLSRIHLTLGELVNSISDSEYASSPLVMYVNDSLCNLCSYLDYVISLKK